MSAVESARRMLPRIHPVVVDALLGLLAAFLALDGVPDGAPTPDAPFDGGDAVGVGLLVLGSVALLWRRRSALAVFAVSGSAFLAYLSLGYALPPLPVAPLVALYTVAGTRRRAVTAAAAGTLAVGAAAAAIGRAGTLTDDRVLASLVAILAVWLVGQHLQAVHARGAQLARDQVVNTRLGIERERSRITRELHDVLAQKLCLIVAQAGAARRAGAEPDAARQTIGMIEVTGREALGEMRHVLGALQADEHPLPVPAQPGVDLLPTLVERLAAAGLPVRLAVHGQPQPLPAQVDAAAYRIVQEALTNSLDHAGATRADVLLCYRPGTLRLRISDDGRSARPDVVLGHGIVGMWQRASLLGGELSVATRTATGAQETGFQVTARLPLDGHGR